MIINGAIAVAELRGMRLQPSAPREMSADKVATSKTENTPDIVRSKKPTISSMASSIAGVRLWPSS